jgi:hypothetical protein
MFSPCHTSPFSSLEKNPVFGQCKVYGKKLMQKPDWCRHINRDTMLNNIFPIKKTGKVFIHFVSTEEKNHFFFFFVLIFFSLLYFGQLKVKGANLPSKCRFQW